MRRFRELTEDDFDQVEKDLEDWGYPRAVESWEWGVSAWFRWGNEVIFWFNGASEEGEPKKLAMHICAVPMEERGFLLDARPFMWGVYTIAQLLDAVELVAIVGHNDSVLRGYLERLGWTEDSRGWMVKSLGDE